MVEKCERSQASTINVSIKITAYHFATCLFSGLSSNICSPHINTIWANANIQKNFRTFTFKVFVVSILFFFCLILIPFQLLDTFTVVEPHSVDDLPEASESSLMKNSALPTGWESRRDRNGRIYYLNHTSTCL